MNDQELIKSTPSPAVVYISGKITGLTHKQVAYKFNKAAKRLIELGFDVINPLATQGCLYVYDPRVIDGSDVITADGWDDLMLEDLDSMQDADMILMLRDWRNSRGARIELAKALLTGKMVLMEEELYVDDN